MRISGAMNKFTTDVSYKNHSYFAKSTVSNSNSTRSIGSSCYQLPGDSTSTAQNVNVKYFTIWNSFYCRFFSVMIKCHKIWEISNKYFLLAIDLNRSCNLQYSTQHAAPNLYRSEICWHFIFYVIENLTPCIRTYTFIHTYTE